jgi:chromosome segregation ATPase
MTKPVTNDTLAERIDNVKDNAERVEKETKESLGQILAKLDKIASVPDQLARLQQDVRELNQNRIDAKILDARMARQEEAFTKHITDEFIPLQKDYILTKEWQIEVRTSFRNINWAITGGIVGILTIVGYLVYLSNIINK